MNQSDSQDMAATIEVVAGSPTAEELAAVVAVLGESAKVIKPTHTESNWARVSKLRGSESFMDLKWRSDFQGEI
jgi:hypothetical protein